MQYDGRIKVHDGDNLIDCDLYLQANGGYFADSGTPDGPRGRIMKNPRTGRIEFIELPGDRALVMRAGQYSR